MAIYQTTQICGDYLEMRFRRDEALLFCKIDNHVTMEAKHIRALYAALKAFEAAEAQVEQAAEVAA